MAAMRYREKMERENNARTRWNVRYGAKLGLTADGRRLADVGKTATLETGTVAIVICGGAMAAGEEPSDMLVTRLERAMAEWWNGQRNTVIVSPPPVAPLCFFLPEVVPGELRIPVMQITTGKESAPIMKDILVAHGCPEAPPRPLSWIDIIPPGPTTLCDVRVNRQRETVQMSSQPQP